jgi:hypothetical protein
MSLTRSRTRNQTTLSKLAKMLAALNGEYAFCMGLLNANELGSADGERLSGHVARLQAKRAAVRLTLLQFNPVLDVDSIGSLDDWRLRLGKRSVSAKNLQCRLLAELT